jgi:AraC-like DNA-binding protein
VPLSKTLRAANPYVASLASLERRQRSRFMSRKLVVSSNDLPGATDAERFSAFMEQRALLSRGWDFERSDAPFEVQFELKAVKGVDIARMDGALNSTSRSARQIADDGDDRFVMGHLLSSAKGMARQNGREIEVDRGFTLLSLSDPSLLAAEGPVNRWMRILMPSRPLVARAPQMGDLLSIPLDDSRGLLRLLFAYAGFVLDNDAVGDDATADMVANHCMDLAALAFGARGDEAELARNRGLRAVRLSRVLNRIRLRFTDPALSAAGIARDLGLSERYVHSLLQESGTTFTARVLALRLEAALASLARDPSRAIADVAYAVGFGDLSYFNRCFRRRFGLTPTAARGG